MIAKCASWLIYNTEGWAKVSSERKFKVCWRFNHFLECRLLANFIKRRLGNQDVLVFMKCTPVYLASDTSSREDEVPKHIDTVHLILFSTCEFVVVG